MRGRKRTTNIFLSIDIQPNLDERFHHKFPTGIAHQQQQPIPTTPPRTELTSSASVRTERSNVAALNPTHSHGLGDLLESLTDVDIYALIFGIMNSDLAQNLCDTMSEYFSNQHKTPFKRIDAISYQNSIVERAMAAVLFDSHLNQVPPIAPIQTPPTPTTPPNTEPLKRNKIPKKTPTPTQVRPVKSVNRRLSF